MRSSIPCLSGVVALITTLTSVSAGPLPRNALHDYAGNGYLLPRNCEAGWCGYAQDFCCSAGEVCVTNADIADCAPATALAGQEGGWAYYTTTYVETVDVPVTKVKTVSSFIGNIALPPPVAQSTAHCTTDQILCGAICCNGATQVCRTDGQCVAKGGASDTIAASYLTPIGPGPTSFSAPVRPTSLTVTTVPITTTQPFLAPVQTTGGVVPLIPVAAEDGGLSPGAIAGIVIGVIAAIIILLLLLACCLLGTGIKGLFGLIGGKKKTRSRSPSPRGHRREIYEERTTTRVAGAAAGTRYATGGGGGGWFGRGGAAAAVPAGRRTTITQTTTEKRRSSGIGKEAAAAGLGLGALWAGLKWKRKRDIEKRDPRGSYYERSHYTGGSRSRYTGSTTDSE